MSAPPFRLAPAPGGPRRRARWTWLLLLALVVYGLALEVRLAEVPKWERPEFRVAGEYLAATHDSYAWLAGAEGLGGYVEYPFSRLTRALEQGFGARPGNVAFWAPAFFAALAAPVTLLWGWLLGGRTAGLASGLLGAILPGFYIRTRLGYWDTDVFTLLGPLTTALCLALLLRRARDAEPASQESLALALVPPLAATYRELPVSPVLDRVHAEALVELGRQAPPGALVWTWWDYGYATQYLARRPTPLDGGRHAGREVYPLALALTTPSARQAAQVLRLAASPEPPWSRGTGAQARDFLERLAREDVAAPRTPPQYLVVAWEDLNLARWITFYGQWDLLTGQSRGGEILRLRRDANIDAERGVVALRHSGEIVRLGGMEVFTGRDVLRRDYDRAERTRLVLNADRNEAFLLGGPVWRGMLLRLLLDDPWAPDIAPYFRLAVDRFPDARIYEIR